MPNKSHFPKWGPYIDHICIYLVFRSETQISSAYSKNKLIGLAIQMLLEGTVQNWPRSDFQTLDLVYSHLSGKVIATSPVVKNIRFGTL